MAVNQVVPLDSDKVLVDRREFEEYRRLKEEARSQLSRPVDTAFTPRRPLFPPAQQVTTTPWAPSAAPVAPAWSISTVYDLVPMMNKQTPSRLMPRRLPAPWDPTNAAMEIEAPRRRRVRVRPSQPGSRPRAIIAPPTHAEKRRREEDYYAAEYDEEEQYSEEERQPKRRRMEQTPAHRRLTGRQFQTMPVRFILLGLSDRSRLLVNLVLP